MAGVFRPTGDKYRGTGGVGDVLFLCTAIVKQQEK
jgi:hypothetical protein